MIKQCDTVLVVACARSTWEQYRLYRGKAVNPQCHVIGNNACPSRASQLIAGQPPTTSASTNNNGHHSNNGRITQTIIANP
jgi:hypothetical protein